MADERKRRWWACVVAVLPVLYVLSAGPAYWLYFHDYITDNSPVSVLKVYEPLEWCGERSDTFWRSYRWYLELWVPKLKERYM